jgi:hypothetical protein
MRAAGTMASSPAPHKGMSVGIPGGCGLTHRLLDLLLELVSSAEWPLKALNSKQEVLF